VAPFPPHGDFISFYLDGCVVYEGEEKNRFAVLADFKDDFFAKDYQIGNYLEINIDKTVNLKS
jgi:hypothetical protein